MAMNKTDLISVTVEYDTVKMTAQHSFGANIYAHTDIKTGSVIIYRDGQRIRKLEDTTIGEYERVLLETAQEAEILKRFQNEL
jgi:hypothetical protein